MAEQGRGAPTLDLPGVAGEVERVPDIYADRGPELLAHWGETFDCGPGLLAHEDEGNGLWITRLKRHDSRSRFHADCTPGRGKEEGPAKMCF